MPVLVIDPACGLMLQVTPVLLTPNTLAVNCWLWPASRVTVEGSTWTVTVGGTRVMSAEAEVTPSEAVAVAVTTCRFVITWGAV